MWPLPGEALSRQIPVERAVEELYAEALRRWVPTLTARVLPTLTAAGTLPPDPSAADDQNAQDGWSSTSDALVIAGISLLWAATVYEALTALDMPKPPLPPLPKGRRSYSYLLDGDDHAPEADAVPGVPDVDELPVTVVAIDPKAVATVLRSTDLTRAEVAEAVAMVENDPGLRAIRDDVLADERQRADTVAAGIQHQVLMASDRAAMAAQKQQLTVEQTATAQREAVADVLDTGGETVRQIAEAAGHSSGAVQNHAVIAAAELGQQDDDPLDAVWIATIDGKTRPTHWAADGQRVPLGSMFTVGGELLAFPCDPRGTPSEVKNCRCRVGILGRDEPLPSDVDRHTERLGGNDAVQRNRQGSQQDEIERRERAGNVRARDDSEGIGRVASGAPSEGQDMAEDDNQTETFRTFTAVLAFFGEPTSDSRMLAKKMDLANRTFPQPVMWCEQTGYGHEDAFTVGVLESADRKGNKLVGTGYMLNTPEADKACNELAHGVTSPSVDLADTEWETTDRDENVIDYDTYVKSLDDGKPIKVYTCITKGELIGATLVATAAFGNTSLTLSGERETRDVALVAAAVAEFKPRAYPAEAFADPKLTAPTPSSSEVLPNGMVHVFGHFACTNSCHRSIQGQCVTPPTMDDFANFHTSPPVLLEDGSSLAVGRLTVGGGHASTARGVSGADAAAHYDNVATCWALVRVGKDEHGLWFSGVRAPWATDDQFEMGLAAPLSGDWRDYGVGLRLTAIHSVNTPGFMVASGATGEDGRPLALVASLAPTPAEVPARSAAVGAGVDVDKLAAAIVRKQREAAEVDQLAARAAARPDLPPPPAPADLMDDLMARAKARA